MTALCPHCPRRAEPDRRIVRRIGFVAALVCSTVAIAGCGSRKPPETAPDAPVSTDPAANAPAARASEPGAPAEAPAPLVHTVASGDTLWALSRRYNVPMDQLVRANALSDPDLLLIGDRLVIPSKHGAAGVPAGRADAPGSYAVGAARGGSVPVDAWIWPVSGGEVMSSFGSRRGRASHRGLDIRARAGQPVFAARPGTVVYAGAGMLDYGNAVILAHDNGLTSLYGHNEELLVREGERVARGQTIARAGMSGNATTVHVHFEVRRYAEALDPMRFLSSASR